MPEFSHVATFDLTEYPHLANVSDMAIATVEGVVTLYTASQADGGLGAFALSAGAQASFVDSQNYGPNRGTLGVVDLDVLHLDGQDYLIPSGRYDDNLAFLEVDASGFTGVQGAWAADVTRGNFTNTLVVSAASGEQMLMATRSGLNGVISHVFNASAELIQRDREADTGETYARFTTDLATIQKNDNVYVFSVDPFETGVSAFTLNDDGTLDHLSSVGVADSVPMNAPVAIETVLVANLIYVLVASSGTDGVVVLRMSQSGKFTYMGQWLDSLDTRFQDISAMESFELGGRSFLVVGGSDGGVTAFEVLPRGQLVELASFEDTFDTALDNVNSIEAQVFGDTVQLFISSQNEDGFTQLELDFDGIGDGVYGSTSRDTLYGTNGDDMIWGDRGADYLYGNNGADVLFDGKGRDRLTGGLGADRFVFLDDNSNDTVLDWQAGVDVLDFSLMEGLTSIDQLEFDRKSWGGAIFYENNKWFIYSKDGDPIDPEDWTVDDFIF